MFVSLKLQAMLELVSQILGKKSPIGIFYECCPHALLLRREKCFIYCWSTNLSFNKMSLDISRGVHLVQSSNIPYNNEEFSILSPGEKGQRRRAGRHLHFEIGDPLTTNLTSLTFRLS